ncbi:dienelactone hydrolase family protein [Paenibacillus dendritiformis]|uniref:dienelactone hydrolase family protein n=2 Tax=Paenibacillus dendritiformis TaxID=130049 RepID=UPI001F427D1A|nr:dienelactone hydrolase family protein [Paenibacillus dendritiformis]
MMEQLTGKTLIILLHEIYGVNDHIAYYRQRFEEQGHEVLTPNLLGRAPFAYGEEAAAYSYFINEVGFDASAREVRGLIEANRQQYNAILLAGFSVGATVAWMCSGSGGLDGIIGFYGSRIRNYADIKPCCPALLYFASEEPFDVPGLARQLRETERTRVEVIAAGHGFMNPFHPSYLPEQAEACMTGCSEFLRQEKRTLPRAAK